MFVFLQELDEVEKSYLNLSGEPVDTEVTVVETEDDGEDTCCCSLLVYLS